MTETNQAQGFVNPETFKSLVADAVVLYSAALETTPGISAAEAEAPEADRFAAHQTRAASLAIQALLAASPLSQRGLMVVLGITCGALLGQCPMEQYQELYQLFQSQFAETIAQVSLAQRPGMNG